MFSVEASTILPHAPARVFAVARARDVLPRWCGGVRVADDAEHGVAVHEASGDGFCIRWELTVRTHSDGTSLHVRTLLLFDDTREYRVAICRMVSRLAAEDLARMAELVGRVEG